MSRDEDADNKESIYLFIINKQSIKDYDAIEMPDHYTATVRTESKMGYAVLKDVLRTRFDLPYDPQSIQTTPEGKPFITNNTLGFNISNCQDYIACAVGYQELGVDIEQHRPVHPKLFRKILTPQEIKNSVTPLRAWVIKEAYSKLLGTGLRLGLTSISAEDLRSQYPNIVLSDKPYYCALFYANPGAHIQVEYALEGATSRI